MFTVFLSWKHRCRKSYAFGKQTIITKALANGGEYFFSSFFSLSEPQIERESKITFVTKDTVERCGREGGGKNHTTYGNPEKQTLHHVFLCPFFWGDDDGDVFDFPPKAPPSGAFIRTHPGERNSFNLFLSPLLCVFIFFLLLPPSEAGKGLFETVSESFWERSGWRYVFVWLVACHCCYKKR